MATEAERIPVFAVFFHDMDVKKRLGREEVTGTYFTPVCCCCFAGRSPALVTEEGRFLSSCFGYVQCTGDYLPLCSVGNEWFTLTQCFFSYWREVLCIFPACQRPIFKRCYGTACAFAWRLWDIKGERGCNLVLHNVDTQCRSAISTLAISPKQ